MPRQVDDGTDVDRGILHGPASLPELPGKCRAERFPLHVRELERERRAFPCHGQRIAYLLLCPAADDDVQIVGADNSRPEELERRKQEQPTQHRRPLGQRSDGRELPTVAREQEMEPPASAEVLPPGVEPLPRQEEAVGLARGQEAIPFLPEVRKVRRILDTLNVIVLEGPHASHRICSGFTAARVTCSSSMPPIR